MKLQRQNHFFLQGLKLKFTNIIETKSNINSFINKQKIAY